MGIGERFGEYFRNIKDTAIGQPHRKKEQRAPLSKMIDEYLVDSYLGLEELLGSLELSEIEPFKKIVEDYAQRVESGQITDRRIIFKVNQLQNLQEKNLEIQIRKAKGENVIESWN